MLAIKGVGSGKYFAFVYLFLKMGEIITCLEMNRTDNRTEGNLMMVRKRKRRVRKRGLCSDLRAAIKRRNWP